MNNNKNVGMCISLTKLLRARNCKKHGDYLGLSLITRTPESMFRAEVKKRQGDYLGRPDAPERIERFILEITRKEWYRTKAQYDILVTEEAAYQKRLASFFIGKKCVASNIHWQVPVSIKVGTTAVGEVYGYVSAVIKETDGTEQHTAVIIGDGTPKYSRYARNMLAKPEYSPELIGAYLGLSETFGPDMNVILVYPRRKEDDVASAFNEHQQIITADLSKLPKTELLRRFQMALESSEGQPDCNACIYESLCAGMDFKRIQPDAELPVQNTKQMPHFTESQESVVNFKTGSCAVYAVPGAGKTTALVHRLVKLLDEGIDPKSILFVTFTNKAAEEIRSRVKNLLQTEFDEELPDIFTYNGLGWQILRDNRHIVGDLKLLTSIDEKWVLISCIDAFKEPLKGYSYRQIEGKYGLLPQLLNTFRRLKEDQSKEELALAQKNHLPEQILKLKTMYEERLKSEHFIDFDQQIVLAKKLLSDYPQICRQYGQRWTYIMADEYQDSSQDNVDLLYSIADAGQRNLVVVGDTDQSIYEWRNGSPKHLLEFASHYPECKQIYMNDNFRSVRQILDASNELISKNSNRIEMYMVAHKDSNAKPYRVKDCGASGVLELIKMLKSRNYEYGDIGILSRTNAPLNKVKVLLDKERIESISPSDYLIKDPFFILFKDILDMFFDGFAGLDLSFYRYLIACGCTIPPKKNLKDDFYGNFLANNNLTPIQPGCMKAKLFYEIDEDADRQEDDIYLAYRRLYRIFHHLYASYDDPMEALKMICREFQADPDMPAIKEMERMIDFQDLNNIENLKDYLTCMVKLNDDRKIEHIADKGKVNLMTAHSSKGKEFPAIIILQAEDFGTTEEERRLLYVAMTRAKKCLFVLESPNEKCEFLDEINDYMHVLQLA